MNIWNRMGGQIKWSAIEILAEIEGIRDYAMLIIQLTTIRDYLRESAEQKRQHG